MPVLPIRIGYVALATALEPAPPFPHLTNRSRNQLQLPLPFSRAGGLGRAAIFGGLGHGELQGVVDGGGALLQEVRLDGGGQGLAGQ